MKTMNNKTQRSIATVSVAALFAFMLSPAVAAISASPESQKYYDAAQAHLKHGDLSAARIELKNAVRTDPTNSDARYELALVYLREGNPIDAAAELEIARTRGYSLTKITIPLTRSYLAAGRYKDLLKIDANSVMGQDRAEVLAAHARAHLAFGNKAAAQKAVTDAKQSSTGSIPVLVADAALLNANGSYAEAEAVLQAAPADATDLDLLLLKGELRERQGDLAGAHKYFDLATRTYPQFINARLKRAAVNIGRNERAAAEEDIAWTLQRSPQHPVALYLRASLLVRDKKYQEATQALIALPQLLEAHPPALYLLATAALESGQHELALEHAQRYANKNPADVNGNRLLALAHQRLGAPAKAVTILEPLAAKLPSDNQIKLQLAEAYLAVGRSQEAVNLFQQGLAADADNANARLALAVGQLRLGNNDAGLDQIEKVVAANPASSEANTLLVLTHLQGARGDAAVNAAKAMISADPTKPDAHNLLGTVYLATNKFADARTAFQAALGQKATFTPAILNLARLEARLGNYAQAKLWFDKAVATEPANMAGYEGLATLALRDGKTDEAVAQLKRAIEQDRMAAAPRVQLIDLLIETNQASQALIEARDFANVAPKSGLAIDALGRAQIVAGDEANGIATYRRLTAAYPDNVEAHRRLAQALMKVGLSKTGPSRTAYVDEARAALDQALKLEPESLAALGDRAEFEHRMQGATAAVTFAQSYSAKDPKSAVRLVVLGDTQVLAQQPAQALQSYQKAAELAPSSMTIQRLYAGQMQAGRKDEALRTLTDWMAKHETDHDVRFALAQHYLTSGQTAQAIAETEKISTAFPDNPVILNNLAWLYGKTDAAKAITLAERAYLISPQSPDVMDTLGWLLVTSANAARAESLLQQAYQKAPERNDIGFHYAVALQANNKSTAAKNVLAKILANETQFAERAEAQATFEKLSVANATN
jgi:putative PEP-CTERM system TPR-repeat lipoprotein